MNVQDNHWTIRRAASASAALPGSLDVFQPSTAAGHDDSIPPTFVVLFDVLVLGLAFVLTRPLAPTVQWWLLPTGPLRLALPPWLGLPAHGSPSDFSTLPSLLWILVVTAPTTVLFLALLGGYEPLVDQSRARVAASSVLAPLLALSIVTLLLFTVKDLDSSRVFTFTFGGLATTGLVGYRMAIRFYLRHQLRAGRYARNVILVGQPAAIAWMTDHFRHHVPAARFRLAGWLKVPDTDATLDAVDVPCLAAVADLGTLLMHRPFHEVIAIQSAGDSNWLRQVIEDCDYFRVRLRIVPEALLANTLRDLTPVFRSEPLRLPEIVLDPPHYDSDALFVKRLIDVVGATVLLVLLSPLLLLVAIAIKLTTPDLSVLFPWRVVGLNGHAFTGYKFTTMVADAEKHQEELESRNEMRGPVFKLKDDPRITKLGRWLRKYSVNELPQLWSVLRGDMSLVGPRPAFRHELDRYVLWQKRKLCVKPGITCLWQISGRNRIHDFDEWVRLDLQYIDRWSLALDLRILARTVWTVVSGSGW